MCVCVCVCECVCIHVCMCIYIYIYIYIYIMYVCVCIYSYSRIYQNTLSCVHILTLDVSPEKKVSYLAYPSVQCACVQCIELPGL